MTSISSHCVPWFTAMKVNNDWIRFNREIGFSFSFFWRELIFQQRKYLIKFNGNSSLNIMIGFIVHLTCYCHITISVTNARMNYRNFSKLIIHIGNWFNSTFEQNVTCALLQIVLWQISEMEIKRKINQFEVNKATKNRSLFKWNET